MNDLKELQDRVPPAKASQEKKLLSATGERINEKIVELTDQKIKQRDYALKIAVFVIALNALILFCCFFLYIEIPGIRRADYSVAIIVAPILSITAITIAFMIGVFKGFNKKEVDGAVDVTEKVFRSANGL